jgi:hydroxymethylpyrimidine pyrophosphatase-like HAD family hydrolase
MKPFLVGIDLHGTLLDGNEEFPEEQINIIGELLESSSKWLTPVTCTGNDITFVKKKLPARVFNAMEGHVLETGCTYSARGKEPEVIYVNREIVAARDKLENLLKKQNYSEVTRFGRRLATVSLFTPKPKAFSLLIDNFLQENHYDHIFSVTWSSVAVDIIPAGFDKLKGLKQAARDRKIIGIADSVNDLPLLKGSDYSFAPSNLAKEAESSLKNGGMKIVTINDTISELDDSTLYKSNFRDARGVSEILKFLKRMLSSIS